MSILDTFYVLFKSDTTDLEKGQKKAKKSTDELQDKIKNTNADTQNLGASFLELTTKAASAVGAVVSVGSAISLALSSGRDALATSFLAESTGQVASNIDEWAQAAERFGGNLESSRATLQRIKEGTTFQRPFGGVAEGRGMPTQFAMTAARFGINVTDGMEVDEILDQVRELFKGRDPTLNLIQGREMGFDAAWVRMLQSSDEEFKKIKADIAAIGTYQDSNLEKFQEFYQLIKNIGQFLRNIANEVSKFLISEDFIKLLKELGSAVIFASIAVTALGAALAIIGFPALITMIGSLAAAFFTLAAGIGSALLPFVLFGLVVAGIWAIIHYWPEVIKSIGGAFSSMFKSLKEEVGEALKFFKDLFDMAGKGIGSIKNLISGKGRPTAEGQKLINEYQQQEMILRAARAMNDASISPLSSQTNRSVIGSNNFGGNSVRIDNMTIETQATDPDGIASGIQRSLERQINTAINNYNTSVLA